MTPVNVRDKEGIAKMYANLGFVIINDAVDPRLVRAVRERIPYYIRQRTYDLEHPIDNLTEDVHVRSLDLEQETADQRVRRLQVCWGYNEKPKTSELELETLLRAANPYFTVPTFQVLKAVTAYHNIPLPKRVLPTFDMYVYANLSSKRREWILPWHTDTVSIIAMFGGEEGILEIESTITKERYKVPLQDGQAAIGFGEKMMKYLQNNNPLNK